MLTTAPYALPKNCEESQAYAAERRKISEEAKAAEAATNPLLPEPTPYTWRVGLGFRV